MEQHIKALLVFARDLRIEKGNTAANEMLGIIGNIRREHQVAIDLLTRATAHVREKGSFGPLGRFVPDRFDPTTQLATDIRTFLDSAK